VPQPQQRLAHRRLADAQPACQLHLGQRKAPSSTSRLARSAVRAQEMITFFNIHGAMVYVDEAGKVTGYEDVFTKIEMRRKHYVEVELGKDVDQYVR
jgi:hypothetical protein